MSDFAPRILALAGGVGGAKLCFGLSQILSPDELQIVVNTGDDFWHLGFAISPDLDTVLYTLAGLANRTQGWGREGETWNFMQGLERLGAPTWFKLGDLDLATHVWRTNRLLRADTLSQITDDLAQRLGVAHRVAPMSDDAVETMVDTDEGRLAFQEYFVARQCRPKVRGFRFDGAREANAAPAFRHALHAPSLQAIVLCPSNPFVSIAPILAIEPARRALEERKVPLIAVSPIVGGQAVKGPAAKMMAELDMPATALGIARHYGKLLDGLVIDEADRELKPEIEAQGCRVHVCNTIMRSDEDRVALAQATLDFADRLRPRRVFRRRWRRKRHDLTLRMARPQCALYAVVPVKTLVRAKTRLAPALSSSQRLRLARRFLHCTLTLLTQHPGASRTIVVSADAPVLQLARAKGMIALPQTARGGINRAIALGCRLAQMRGAKAVLVLPTDLPHLTLQAVRRFSSHSATPTIRLAADRHDSGTNAVYLQPPDCRFSRFGEDSLRQHVAQARAIGIAAQIVRGQALGFDVDVPADYRLLQTLSRAAP